MRPWALCLEYDGSAFNGWQRQGSLPTVQAILETAATALTGGAAVTSVAAGRTDAGVHASAQVAMLALPEKFRARQVCDALNFHLRPHPVVVLAATPAAEGWHPRFSAIGREYRYRILNRRTRPALARHQVWHVQRPLDAVAMQEGANHLLGLHDFTSFRATACQAKSPVRTLDRLDISRSGDAIEILVAARSFLHHQVRNMVGTLKLVGDGAWPASRVAEVLERRQRSAAGPTAPPDGLCLVAVRYRSDPFG